MNNKARHIAFIIFSVFAFAAMLYHTAGAVQPFDATPAWRHSLFIGICTVCVYGLLKRPKWFIWFFGILTVQQLYSHGSHFISILQGENKVNLIDAAVLLLMPPVFILLLIDRSKNNTNS
jgi:hypothetical protein